MSPLTRRCIPDRRTVLSIVGVLLVVVVIVGAGAYMVLGRPDAEGRVSSSETPPTATASALASASASVSVLATLSVEEQALRDAALSTPKPERPAGMDEFTVEGAVATGEYVLVLYPYVYATGDLSDWQAMSDPECGFCNNVITKVTKLHDAGGWVDPSPHEVVAVSYGVSEEDPNVWAVSFHYPLAESLDHDGSGGTSSVKAEDVTFVLQMRWTGQTWIVEQGEAR